VNSNLDCEADADAQFSIGGPEIPDLPFPDNFNDATFQVNVTDEAASAGRWLVCFSEDTMDYAPIASDSGRFLNIGLAEADLAPPQGFFNNQHFTATAGSAATIVVEGNEVEDTHKLSLKVGSCAGENATFPDSFDMASATDSAVTYENVMVGDEAGRYRVCIGTEDVGDVTVTARADIGWTYVLDPEGEGSVEVSGTGLNWKYDRIMITDCKATCGVSGPAEGIFIEGAEATLGGANTYLAQNDLFDAADDERTLVDLPSELRTYTTVVGHYCKGNNLAAAELGPAEAHTCHNKCAADSSLPGCAEYMAVD